jgi:hypothetical protein
MNESVKKKLVPKAAISRFYSLLGIAELGMGRPVNAAKAFVKAYKMATIPETKQGYEAAHGWKNLEPNQRKVKLDSLLAGMPTEPLSFPDFTSWLGPQVESEHWVMRELGYKGPIPYEDKIKSVLGVYMTTKPHPNRPLPGPRTLRLGAVKPEVLRKHVESYRQQLQHPLTGGRALAWISLGEDQIGEESVLGKS